MVSRLAVMTAFWQGPMRTLDCYVVSEVATVVAPIVQKKESKIKKKEY